MDQLYEVLDELRILLYQGNYQSSWYRMIILSCEANRLSPPRYGFIYLQENEVKRMSPEVVRIKIQDLMKTTDPVELFRGLEWVVRESRPVDSPSSPKVHSSSWWWPPSFC